ncbi:hypothetical protein BpHYR1_022622 [Brachionus plicatilis]|uniref:Uncharacterized protein n=1 Tax=Brachionus plicatilis TaxID=10195 RepID=A0A3M7RXI4_BRAPC|nr:hypothetical protein BpHYR1_022622 [Brachionus plicatilis]
MWQFKLNNSSSASILENNVNDTFNDADDISTNKRSTAKTYDCKCFVKNVELKWLREDNELVQINVGLEKLNDVSTAAYFGRTSSNKYCLNQLILKQARMIYNSQQLKSNLIKS